MVNLFTSHYNQFYLMLFSMQKREYMEILNFEKKVKRNQMKLKRNRMMKTQMMKVFFYKRKI